MRMVNGTWRPSWAVRGHQWTRRAFTNWYLLLGPIVLADGVLLQITEQLPRFAERPFLDDHNFRDVQLTLKGEFTWTLCFRPSFVAALSYEGFLSICSELGGSAQPGLYVLLPKMHEILCKR